MYNIVSIIQKKNNVGIGPVRPYVKMRQKYLIRGIYGIPRIESEIPKIEENNKQEQWPSGNPVLIAQLKIPSKMGIGVFGRNPIFV